MDLADRRRWFGGRRVGGSIGFASRRTFHTRVELLRHHRRRDFLELFEGWRWFGLYSRRGCRRRCLRRNSLNRRLGSLRTRGRFGRTRHGWLRRSRCSLGLGFPGRCPRGLLRRARNARRSRPSWGRLSCSLGLHLVEAGGFRCRLRQGLSRRNPWSPLHGRQGVARQRRPGSPRLI